MARSRAKAALLGYDPRKPFPVMEGVSDLWEITGRQRGTGKGIRKRIYSNKGQSYAVSVFKDSYPDYYVTDARAIKRA